MAEALRAESVASSVEALTPKRRGRKRPAASERKLSEIRAEKVDLEKELHRMRQKYEVAQALLDLQRKAERGERLPGEKKTPRPIRHADPRSASLPGTKTPLAGDVSHDSAVDSRTN